MFNIEYQYKIKIVNKFHLIKGNRTEQLWTVQINLSASRCMPSAIG